MPLSTDAVLELMQSVAAEVITPRFRSLSESQIDEKRPGDLVTVADHEAEELITKALLEAYPDAVVLGEEAYATAPELMEQFRAADHGFTVDPVDGTKNFVNGSKDHAVMIAEVIDGETVRGWIWQPEHEVAWVAELGGGVRRNGEPIHRAPAGDQPQGATSIWSRRGRQPVGLPKLVGTWVCCGVDYPKLIEGEADYVLYGHTNPWDHLPGTLMVREAGGRGLPSRRPPYAARSEAPGSSWRPTRSPSSAPARPAPTSGLADIVAPATGRNPDDSGGFRFNGARVASPVTADAPTGAGASASGEGAREPPGPQQFERTLRDPHFVDPASKPAGPTGRPARSGVSRRGFLGYVVGASTLVVAADLGTRAPAYAAVPSPRPDRRGLRPRGPPDRRGPADGPADHHHDQQGRHRLVRAARAWRSARASPPRPR